ncbi:hypothetical protein H7347_04315 [Corynebacterium sp. zg-331]|uniref:hypothetical protein n=1 Tax=unclassified Corynebacterium TaxID=2624378 RepID=UPI00128E8A65|nr:MULTISPECIES: hypothetical protein [unclassified Corynebacterium]MBC3185804.1 hypothetical protein [Corynebacterium sp. zg-331]MPV52297.1 hypothetical protein [Corynebacterium sp. zg331]
MRKYRFPDGSRLIEGEGGGIRWVRTTLAQAELRPPIFHDKGVSFAAIISQDSLVREEDLDWLEEMADGTPLSREQRSVLLAMRAGESWSNSDARRRLGLDSVEARAMLQDLVSRGLVAIDGMGRSTMYFLAQQGEKRRQRQRFIPTGFWMRWGWGCAHRRRAGGGHRA